MKNLYDVLFERGLIFQATESAEDLRNIFSTPIVGYIGFDPTADSLHVGSLVPLMCLHWMGLCKHHPIALVGGATGMIGDPSGKTEMRKVLTEQELKNNEKSLFAQFSSILAMRYLHLENNLRWIREINWISMLREFGPHFSINKMLTMDSVKSRIEGNGLSFLEFNYMILQAIDFWHLNKTQTCVLQMGGQDQWGNIVMGIDLVRKMENKKVVGITTPLITKPDGTKFGKTEKGTIWLDSKKTSIFDFFQFWRNIPDSDVRKFLLLFTTLLVDQIDHMMKHTDINKCKEKLAFEITKFVHGQIEAEKVLQDSVDMFGENQDPTGDSIPHGPLTANAVESIPIIDILVSFGLTNSKGEARRLIEGKGLKIDDVLVETIHEKISINGRDHIVLKIGKKKIFRIDII